VEIADFLKHDGIPATRGVTKSVTKGLALGELRDRFIEARRAGREQSTQKTSGTHFKPLVATLGEKFPIADLTQDDLRRHIERRAGLEISATTIRKEIITLRTAWHWAVDTGLIAGDYPNKGLIYPKEDELPPYQTREEIERQAGGGGRPDARSGGRPLGRALPAPARDRRASGARPHPRPPPWSYPLACMAGHTGARRSELLAMRVADVDYEGGVTIREKKRVKGKRSTRRAPLTPLLVEALKEWMKEHPGGQALFYDSGLARNRPAMLVRGHAKRRAGTVGSECRDSCKPDISSELAK
jgi:integrase